MRRTKKSAPPQFFQTMKDAGWLTKTTPYPMMVSLGIDDEYVYVDRADRLVHVHISAGDLAWEAKRYSREPFGDYTTVYQALGSGIGVDSLQQFLKSRSK